MRDKETHTTATRTAHHPQHKTDQYNTRGSNSRQHLASHHAMPPDHDNHSPRRIHAARSSATSAETPPSLTMSSIFRVLYLLLATTPLPCTASHCQTTGMPLSFTAWECSEGVAQGHLHYVSTKESAHDRPVIRSTATQRALYARVRTRFRWCSWILLARKPVSKVRCMNLRSRPSSPKPEPEGESILPCPNLERSLPESPMGRIWGRPQATPPGYRHPAGQDGRQVWDTPVLLAILGGARTGSAIRGGSKHSNLHDPRGTSRSTLHNPRRREELNPS